MRANMSSGDFDNVYPMTEGIARDLRERRAAARHNRQMRRLRWHLVYPLGTAAALTLTALILTHSGGASAEGRDDGCAVHIVKHGEGQLSILDNGIKESGVNRVSNYTAAINQLMVDLPEPQPNDRVMVEVVDGEVQVDHLMLAAASLAHTCEEVPGYTPQVPAPSAS